MTTLGAIFLPQNPPERLRGVARAADEAGLEELWLWEDCFLAGGMSAAAAALAWTSNVRVGVGITPIPFRNVAVAAMEMATLRRMFGERAIIGIGHGVQEWMGQVGARAESPMTLLREYASALRALLERRDGDHQGPLRQPRRGQARLAARPGAPSSSSARPARKRCDSPASWATPPS